MKLKLIQQGAEAKILFDSSKNLIIKDRISKSYRHPILDAQIRKRRTKSETKLLTKASKIINCPTPTHKANIYQIPMPFIKGKKLSENLNKFSLEKQKEICREIGSSIAKLHKENIIHGDLTTSNMILVKDKIYFIDFGLGFISRKIEDKAVDLHLLKHALEAKHFQNYEILTKETLNQYKNILGEKESEKIFERIKSVEKRRRYRH
ncbi:Kae1-associated serine/threonine protein kinase [Candidatus Pacearchaeota archaeon]|nr:Kae1-associated serine/threonine protein kinase [Candidatus Pacearchaeota archaeon]MBI2057110.1 Kae1-associated serine/threonine protein kinase [Candidatus Pacearchaeota archaeon]